ncbi:unnamed protein product [Vicia faba]|uniref:Replication protein A 70 kDa DNA-binding subunit B/D first OB fold domain-containing protein n=1 Tax=Vicia faba TaxID=3906 RepID=A0AAV0ZAQ0_VICFA|nr:unnamed protein product [Vicia faba]
MGHLMVAGYRFPSQAIERICDINDSKELWKVVIWVHHKWNVLINNKEHFEMIYVDKAGGDIHVIIPVAHISVFDEKLLFDHTYTIANFKVQPNVSTFRPSVHKFMLKFTGGTSVGDDNKHEIHAKPLVFTGFSEIINDNYNNDLLIDVIGMVEGIGYYKCSRFIKFTQDRDNSSDPTVLLLQYEKVKEEGGKFLLSVINTYNVMLICLDAGFALIKDFIDCMPKDFIVIFSGHMGSSSQLSS